MRCRYFLCVEIVCDLPEALASGARRADPFYEFRSYQRRPTRSETLRTRLWRSAALLDQALELIDRNQPRSPGHLDRLDMRQHTTDEGRAAHAESRRGLRACVCKSLDTLNLTDDLTRHAAVRRHLPSRLCISPPESAPGHSYNVHKR